MLKVKNLKSLFNEFKNDPKYYLTDCDKSMDNQ